MEFASLAYDKIGQSTCCSPQPQFSLKKLLTILWMKTLKPRLSNIYMPWSAWHWETHGIGNICMFGLLQYSKVFPLFVSSYGIGNISWVSYLSFPTCFDFIVTIPMWIALVIIAFRINILEVCILMSQIPNLSPTYSTSYCIAWNKV